MNDSDTVFRALADPSRRKLLDALNAHDAQALTELCEHLDMTRQAVTQHLNVLESANLVATSRRGTARPQEAFGRNLEMAKTKFTYVTYIATTAETLWKALLDGEFTRQYWDHENVSDWQPGSEWEHRRADATRAVVILGEVVAASAPNHLVITWADPGDRGKRDRHSRVTFDIETVGEMVRLTVTHDDLDSDSEMLRKISLGWPRVLSSLKSLLETGRPLNTWAGR